MAEPDMDARKRAEAIAEELIATYGAFASNAALPRGEHPGEECSRMFTACITSAIKAAVAQEREACAQLADPVDDVLAGVIRARGVGGKTDEGEGNKPGSI